MSTDPFGAIQYRVTDLTWLAAGPILSTRTAVACSRSVIKLTAQSTSVGARGNGGTSIYYFMASFSRPVPPSSGQRHADCSHSKSQLQICFSNIRGLRSNFDEVSHFLQVRSPHLLAVLETKLDSSVSSSEFTPDGYTLHRMDKAPSHGLALFAKTSLP